MSDMLRRKKLDVAIAITVFLARAVHSGVDSIVEEKLSISPHDVNSVVGKMVVPYVRNGDDKVTLKDVPVSSAIHALLRTRVIGLDDEGFTVSGRLIRDVAVELFSEEIAESIEKYLLSTITTDPALLRAAVSSASKLPTWFSLVVADNSPIDVAVDVIALNYPAWSQFPAEHRARLLKRMTGYHAKSVMRRAPWVISSGEVLLELLSKVTEEELPETATELIATHAPDLIGLSNPKLVEVGSVKLVDRHPAIVRVDILYGLSPLDKKEFTVIDRRTRLGIVIVARNVDEAVREAYFNLIDAYLEFNETVSELENYSKMYGLGLSRVDEYIGEFRIPGVRVSAEDDYVIIPLQPGFRTALENALSDIVKNSRDSDYNLAT